MGVYFFVKDIPFFSVFDKPIIEFSQFVPDRPKHASCSRSYFKTSRYCIKGGESHIYCIFNELEN